MYQFLRVFSRLPLWFLRYLASVLAFFIVLLPDSSMRRIVQINLKLVYPQLDHINRQRLEQATIRSQCLTAVESIKSWGMPTDYSIRQITQVSGMSVLTEALKNPNGVILVVPHFGTWEMMNAWLSQYTSPVIMYKPSKDAGTDQFMLEARQRLNATLVPTNESGVRQLFKALKQGGVTAILPDHVPHQAGGIISPFFGHATLSSTLVSKLAAKTQCVVLGLSCLRQENGTGFRVLCEALHPDISSRDLQLSVDTLNLEIERMINRAPEQYLWGYKRFKHMPNRANIYKKTVHSS